jgi:hypothetical protein
MMQSARYCVEELEHGQRYAFADWPTVGAEVPMRIGVYTIWDDDDFLAYVGIAYTANPNRQGGLRGRLSSHASGQRSGDRFCVYVADLYVLPRLTQEAIKEIAAGAKSFDAEVRDFIRKNFFFRYAVTDDDQLARQLEVRVKQGALTAGPPRINPLPRS